LALRAATIAPSPFFCRCRAWKRAWFALADAATVAMDWRRQRRN